VLRLLHHPPPERQLNAGDAAAYQALRLRALREEPAAFSAEQADEATRTIVDVEQRISAAADGSVCMWGAFSGAELAGFVAFLRPQRPKLRHGAELAGMYVAPEFRRCGMGLGLLNGVIKHARSLGDIRRIKLGVNRSNLAARNLYLSAGFVRFGIEPEALKLDGIFHDEEHYSLLLASSR